MAAAVAVGRMFILAQEGKALVVQVVAVRVVTQIL